MVVLFKKGLSYKEGDAFPIISIPVNAEGEEKEFTDFQWWGPTKDWNEWLKSNAREWQAESENFTDEELRNKIYESFVDSGEIDPVVMDFKSFNNLLNEAEEGEEATDDEKKRYTKFVLAYNRLKQEGKIKDSLEINSFKKGETYAIISDTSENLESRQAYKTQIISELPTIFLAKIEESLPFGEIKDEGDGNVLLKIAQFGQRVAATAIGGAIVLGGTYFGAKKLWGLGKSFGSRILRRGALNTLASETGAVAASETGAVAAAETAAAAAAETTAVTAAETAAAAAAETGAATAAETALVAAGETAAGISTGAVVGIAALVLVAASAVQRLVNWTSDSQAPTLSDLEDTGANWVVDSFQPGTIPDGSEITVCWTQSSGNGWFADLLVNADTRTTMDLIKLGNFNGRSVFILVGINSKEYSAILKSKEVVLLSFDEKVNVKRGWFDNDELEFRMISVDKDEKELIFNTIFRGYCSWEDMESAYRGADDAFIGVPPNAPDEYSFHAKYGDEKLDINITGELIKDLSSIDTLNSTFGENKSEEVNDSYNSEKYLKTWKSLVESSEVLDFHKFSEAVSVESILEEEDSNDVKLLTKTEMIAAYEVKSIDFADKSITDKELPKLETFVIPDISLEAKDNDPISVNPLQDVKIEYPRRGIIIIENEIAPEPILAPTGGSEGGDFLGGGVPIEVTKDEIKSKHRDNPDFLNALGLPDIDKIKDKDRDDKIKLLDFITPEEKEQLGIEDWEYIKKVKVYKDGKTGDPYLIKFKSGGADSDRKRKINSSDPAFGTALKVANRIQAGFEPVESKEDEED